MFVVSLKTWIWPSTPSCGSPSFLEDPELLGIARPGPVFASLCLVKITFLQLRRDLKTTLDFKTFIQGFNVFKDLYTNLSEKIWLILY